MRLGDGSLMILIISAGCQQSVKVSMCVGWSSHWEWMALHMHEGIIIEA